jgi:malate dehydrogenase
MKDKKISIIGSGKVGSTTAHILAYKEMGDIVLFNRTSGMAKGIALDLKEGSPLEDYDVEITGTGDYKDTKNSDIVVITAGMARKPGMSRDDLLMKNASIVKDVTKNVVKYSPKSIIIVVTNPLDAMVQVAYKTSKFPRNRVIGMAGVLDSSRFRSFISMELNISIEDTTALVLGSHGDLMVPLVSHATAGGIPISNLISKKRIDDIVERTRNAGAEIVKLEEEGSAYYAPAYSVVQMVESIAKDKKRILPCSVYLKGEYGIKDVFVGIPAKLGSGGVEDIIEIKLSPSEKKALMKSADAVRELMKKV